MIWNLESWQQPYYNINDLRDQNSDNESDKTLYEKNVHLIHLEK